MSDLVRHYREYYREQTPQSVEALFGAMLDYDFSSYFEDTRRIFAMWREAKCMGESSLLRSNGSRTGRPRTFRFGPHFGLWRNRIESFLRARENKTAMIVFVPGRKDCEGYRVAEAPDNTQKDYDVMGNWYSNADISKFFNLVSEIHNDFGPINIYTLPNIWIPLVTNPFFRKEVQSNISKINCMVTSDFDAHFKKIEGVHWRDQMVDWSSGLNFFVCRFATKHFLPAFISLGRGCLNLLNLKRSNSYFDDLVSIGDLVATCGCGRPFLPCEMTFHFRNRMVDDKGHRFDPSRFFNSLQGRYNNLQLHQNLNDKVTFLYSSADPPKDDLGFAGVYFASMGLEIDFAPDKYYSIGRKCYLSWRSEDPEIKDFFVPEEK